ncbi:hypothetical protein BH09PLA1_BH09PLA1_27840 [soil metagenome]
MILSYDTPTLTMTTQPLDYSSVPIAAPVATPVAPPIDRTVRPWQIAVLALIVIVASGLRFGLIGTPVYELDEYWHAELSTGRGSAQNHQPKNVLYDPGPRVTSLKDAPPWWKVWSHMDDTVHPPLYPQLLRFWRAMIGEGPGESRSLGALANVLSILVLFDVARRLHGTRTALWAAAIMAVAAPQIMLARTLRGYSTALLFMLCLADVVVSLEQHPAKPRRRLILLGLLTLCSALTHYFTTFILTAIGIYALLRGRGRVRSGAILAMCVAAIVFLLVWGPWMLPQRTTLPAKTDDWINDGWPGHTARVAEWATSLPLRMLFEPRTSATRYAILGATLFIVPIFLLRRRRDLLLWVFWLWLSMLPLLAMDLLRDTKHLFHIRYIMAAGPAVFALLAAMLNHVPQVTLRTALPAVSVLACMLSIGSAFEEPRIEYDELAQFIDDRIRPDEPVVIYAQHGSWGGNALFLVLTGQSKSYPWPLVMLDQKPAPQSLLAQLRANGSVWLLCENESLEPGEILPGGRAFMPESIHFANHMTAWHVMFDASTSAPPTAATQSSR